MDINKLTIKDAKDKLKEYEQLKDLFNIESEKNNIDNDYKDKYVLIRANRAGVFAGYIESTKNQEVIMTEARRLWYWDGAASLSQLAMEGVKKPENCKFPIPIERIKIFDVIEIIETTKKAEKSIKGVSVWQQ